MAPWRTVLAVFAGYLTLLVLQVLGNILVAVVLRGQVGSSGNLIGGEIVALISGIAAGATTARLAPSRPLSHATALGLAVFTVIVLANAIVGPASHHAFPAWYSYVIAFLGGAGAFAGGALASH